MVLAWFSPKKGGFICVEAGNLSRGITLFLLKEFQKTLFSIN